MNRIAIRICASPSHFVEDAYIVYLTVKCAMTDYKFPEMYFYCDDLSIQRQVERIAKDELQAGKSVTFHGKPFFDYKLLMDAVEEYTINDQLPERSKSL